MTINILGTNYEIMYESWMPEGRFAENGWCGVCYENVHKIYICRMDTVPAWKNAEKDMVTQHEKLTLRHEIVHAFFNESGLMESSSASNEGWARNEEMVDWIAIQGPKIYKAWEEARAL